MSKKGGGRQAALAKVAEVTPEELEKMSLDDGAERGRASRRMGKDSGQENNGKVARGRQEKPRREGKRPPVLLAVVLLVVLVVVILFKTSLGASVLSRFAGKEEPPSAQTFDLGGLPNIEDEEQLGPVVEKQQPEIQTQPQTPLFGETQPESVVGSTFYPEQESNTDRSNFFAQLREKELVKKLLAEFGEEKGIVPYFTQEHNFPNFVTTVVQAVSGFILLAFASIIPLALLLIARLLWGKKIERKVGEQIKKAQTSATKKVERWVGKETADRLMLFFVVMGVLCVILGAVAKDPDTASVLNIGSQLSLGFLVSVGLYQFVGLTEAGTKKANEFMGIIFSDTVLEILGFTALAIVAALFGVLALGLAFPDVMSITNSKLLDTVATAASRLPEYIRYATGLGLAVGSIIKIREIKKE